jgi:pumilio family protein 6
LEILEQVREIRKTTSKKDEETRRSELVAALSPHLLSGLAKAANELTLTAFGAQFITSVLLNGSGDKLEALQAVADAAGGDPNQEAAEGEVEIGQHISQGAAGGRMLRSLIQGGKYDKEQGKTVTADEQLLKFADMLYPVIKEHIMEWATGPSSFVVVGLLEASHFSESKELKSILKKNKKALEKAATEETAMQKAARESREATEGANDDKKKNKKNKAKKEDKAVGNAGSKILLSKL